MSTVFTKAVTINAPEKDVVFNGVDFTKDAFIKIQAAKSVTFKNCRFYGLEATAKTMGITLSCDTKLIVEGCFFGKCGEKLYNFFELNGKLADGSYISNNYFVWGCCSHNEVNVYGAADDATITINNNYIGSIRIGPKGAPQNVKVNIKGNEYKLSDNPDPEWPGMIVIQPYGTQTTSFNGITIDVANTKTELSLDKLVYIYAGTKDTKFNWQTNYPVLYMNGKLVEEIDNLGDPVEGTKPGEDATVVEEPAVNPAPETPSDTTTTTE